MRLPLALVIAALLLAGTAGALLCVQPIAGDAYDDARSDCIDPCYDLHTCRDPRLPPSIDGDPAVNIDAPTSGSNVRGTVTIQASANAADGVQSVTFLVDGTQIAVDTTAPYTATWDASSSALGTHTITARATDTDGDTDTDSITLNHTSAPVTPLGPTEATNILVTNGEVHLCGTHWADHPPITPIQHGLCDEVETIQNGPLNYHRYTCTVLGETWFWRRNPATLERGREDWQEAVDKGHLTAEQQTWDAVACDGGNKEPAVEKYTPDGARKYTCARSRCYAGSSQCVAPGRTYPGGYTCTQMPGTTEAVWQSHTAELAELLLGEAQGDYVLNCGPADSGVNEAPAESGYCQLLLLNGNQEATEIFVGVAYPNGTAPDLTEMERLHPDALEDEFLYVYRNDTQGLAYMSQDTETSGGIIGVLSNLWGRLQSMLGGQAEIRSKTASRIYLTDIDGVEQQWAVEYVPTETCASGQMIIGPTSECYTPGAWREVISTR